MQIKRRESTSEQRETRINRNGEADLAAIPTEKHTDTRLLLKVTKRKKKKTKRRRVKS